MEVRTTCTLINYTTSAESVHHLSTPPQDTFCLYTPGGGGYGKEEDSNGKPRAKLRRLNEAFPERGSVFEYRMAQEGV